jgi:hypothetical protein
VIQFKHVSKSFGGKHVLKDAGETSVLGRAWDLSAALRLR